MKNSSPAVAYLLILLAVTLFGVNISVLKTLIPATFSVSNMTLIRIVTPCILFWITSLFIQKDEINKHEIRLLLILGVIGIYGFMNFYNMAIHVGSPIDVSLILTLSPVIVTSYYTLTKQVPFQLRKFIGILFSLAGAGLIIVMSGQSTHHNDKPIGIVYALLAISCYSVYLIGIKNLTQKYAPITLLKWAFISASVVTLIANEGAIFKIDWQQTLSLQTSLLVSFVVVGATYLAFILVPYCISIIGVERVTLFQNCIPVIASVTAIMLGQSVLRWDQPVAGVLLFIGLYLASQSNGQATSKTTH